MIVINQEKLQAREDAKALLEVEALKQSTLSTLKVTTASGKVFYADESSRLDIANAIQLSGLVGKTSVLWKLAEEFEGSRYADVSLEELQEALYIALQTKATLVGAVQEEVVV